jgi:hypothetical protein
VGGHPLTVALSLMSEATPAEYFPDEIGIAICLYGHDLEPSEVSALLNSKPYTAHRRGERKGLKSAPFKQGAWIQEVRRFEPIDPDAMLEVLFASMVQDKKVWEQLAARFEIRLHVGVHTDVGCNFIFSPHSVREIASRGASIKFDIYAYGDNEG